MKKWPQQANNDHQSGQEKSVFAVGLIKVAATYDDSVSDPPVGGKRYTITSR